MSNQTQVSVRVSSQENKNLMIADSKEEGFMKQISSLVQLLFPEHFGCARQGAKDRSIG
jgi:hypothetical protein